MLGVDPPANGAPDDLLERLSVPRAIGRGILQRLDHLRENGVEDGFIFGETTSVNLWPDNDSAGLSVDRCEDGDETLFGKDAAILEIGIGDLAHAGTVDVDVTQIELAHDGSDTIAQVDDRAILGDDGVLFGNTRENRQRLVGHEVTLFAVHRQHVLRAQDVVAVEQLSGGSVARNMNLGGALVHHGGAELHETVDHPVYGILVAGNEARGQDNGVALADDDLVFQVGHARQNGHRFALAAGRHVDQFVVGQVGGLFGIQQYTFWHLQKPEVGGDPHVAHHGAPHQHDATAVGVGGIQHLLHAVNVTGEAGDDDPARGLGDNGLEDRSNVALTGGEAGNIGIGRVDHEQVDAGLAEAGERAKIGDAIIQRQLIHLEVTGVKNGAGDGGDGDGECIRNRVIDGHKFEVERAELLFLALGDGERVRRDAVLFELRLDEGEGQGRTDQRDVVAQAKEVRNGTDVVFVTVGEHDADNVVEAIANRRKVGQDQVNAGLVLFWKEDATVDDENLAIDLETGHVAADLTEAPDGDDAEGAGTQLGWLANSDGHSVLTICATEVVPSWEHDKVVP